MTIKANTFEGGTNGTTITIGNSGGGSGDTIDYVAINGVGSAMVFSNAQAAHGTLSGKITPVASNTCYFQYGTSVAPLATVTLAARFYVYMTSATTSAMGLFFFYDNSGARATSLHLDATGKLYARDTTGTTLWTATSAFPLNQWVRVELFAKIATTTTGEIHAKYYLGDSMTLVDGVDLTNTNNGASGTNTYRGAGVGKQSSDAYATAFYIDDFKLDSAAAALIGPVGTNTPPTCSPGGTQTIAAGALTLTGTATDSGGTISSLVWTLTSGPNTPSVSNTPSGIGTASASATGACTVIPGVYVFTLTATDNSASVTTGTTTVYVYAASGVNVSVASVGASNYTLVGSAGTFTAALNDVDATTYAQSPSAPNAEVLPVVLNPIGPLSFTIYVSLLQSPSSPLIPCVVRVYKSDGTTLLYTSPAITLTGSEVDVAVVPDAPALAAIPNPSDRQALVVKVVNG